PPGTRRNFFGWVIAAVAGFIGLSMAVPAGHAPYRLMSRGRGVEVEPFQREESAHEFQPHHQF
ncbi:MAG: hypothetical protein ABI604_11175, partial [Nitrospirota bacterium]